MNVASLVFAHQCHHCPVCGIEHSHYVNQVRQPAWYNRYILTTLSPSHWKLFPLMCGSSESCLGEVWLQVDWNRFPSFDCPAP